MFPRGDVKLVHVDTVVAATVDVAVSAFTAVENNMLWTSLLIINDTIK
ncbi:hypothetical protein [Undibacterium sp. SXout20W]